mgnify:CR=1 FL=1
MAGHSKWANIKHRKAAQDSKRSKIFTKIIRELTTAAKEGGADEETNPRLRLAIQNAKKVNMPKDVMERAIKKAEGGDGDSYVEATYEGYANGGIAVMVECQTDNINRTVANIRTIFNKAGGNLGVSGSVSYLFERKGVFNVKAEGVEEEDLMLNIIDAGVEEIENNGEVFTVTCPFEQYGDVSKAIDAAGYEVDSAALEQIPATYVQLDLESSKKVLNLIDKLEDDDDVQQVFHNLEMTDELQAYLESEQ